LVVFLFSIYGSTWSEINFHSFIHSFYCICIHCLRRSAAVRAEFSSTINRRRHQARPYQARVVIQRTRAVPKRLFDG